MRCPEWYCAERGGANIREKGAEGLQKDTRSCVTYRIPAPLGGFQRRILGVSYHPGRLLEAGLAERPQSCYFARITSD